MCGGASSDSTAINQEQIQFYKNMNAQYAQVFGQDQAITGALTAAFTPILSAGPTQPGFSAPETTSLNTTATENIAQNYAQAQKATAQILAARGGGNTLLPSSVDANLIAQNTNLAAQQRSQAQNQITQASYNQGRQNWLTAANVLGSTAGLLNPTGYASAATSSGTAAANEANAITSQNNSIWNSVIGSLGQVGGLATGAAIQKWG